MDKILIPDSKAREIEKDTALLLKEQGALTIDNIGQCAEAAHFFAKVRARPKRIDEIYDAFVKPFENALKDAKNKLKMLSDPYEKVAVQVKEAMESYLIDYMEELTKLAAKSKEPIEDLDFSVRTENGLVYMSERWDYDVEDITKVPSEFLTTTVNSKKVREAIADGEREIAGLTIQKIPSIGLRQ